MTKRLIKYLLLFIPQIFISQEKVNVSVEAGLSWFNGFEPYSTTMREINLVVQYKSIEAYGGIIQNSSSDFAFSNKGYTVLGPLLGMKYHFLNKNRKSHLFTDFNLHWRSYYHNAGTGPLGGKTELTYYGDLISKLHATNIQLSIGYEPVVLKRISFPITCGVGMVHHKGIATATGLMYGYSDINKWEFSPYLKIALRIYLFKKKPAANNI